MKKETVNIFQEGLNMDLNPIVTPNNVLTDALNATTITFNGDELSLQTDAGNTKIKVSGKDEYVKLSNGYYPLGIKEYGGVLYIVSGKSLENNLRELKENTDYFVNDVILLRGVYYYNNENTTIEEIPEVLDSKWTHLGNLDEARKKFNYIEVGSYPAPEFSDDQNLYGKTNIFSGKNSFYRTYVINDNFFKSGRRIKFTPDTRIDADISNVTTNDDVKFYIVKLLHQLDNGMLDLTDDIWEQFIEHKNETGDTATHWLMSDSFSYYCPTRFKGKLLLQVIFDEPENFEFANRPEISFLDPEIDSTSEIETSSHKIVFDLSWENSSNISIVNYNLLITDFNGNVIKDSEGNSIGDIKEITTPKYTFYIPYRDINSYESYSGISYLITPNFSYNGNVLDPLELPNEFVEKFKISGTRLLEERYNEIYFITEQSRCVGNNMRDYDIAIMSNRNGNIGLDLELSETQYIFLKKGATKQNENQKLIGLFEIGPNNKPIVVEEYDSEIIEAINALNSISPNLYEHVKTQLKSTNMRLYDTSCSEVEIIIKFSSSLPAESPTKVSSNLKLSFSQPEVGKDDISYSIDGRNVYLNVNTTVNLNMMFNGGEMFTVWEPYTVINKELLKEGAIFNYGLITSFQPRNKEVTNYFLNSPSIPLSELEQITESESIFLTNNTGNLNRTLLAYIVNNNKLAFEFTHSNRAANIWFDSRPGSNRIAVRVEPGLNANDWQGPYQWYINYEITQGVNLNNSNYINIPDPNNYIQVGDDAVGYLIFERKSSFITIGIINRNVT